MAERRAPTERFRRAFVRAIVGSRRRVRTRASRTVMFLVLVLAGFMLASATVVARGQDLRPNRNTDLVSLVRTQTDRNADLTANITQLRAEVDRLTKQQGVAGVDTTDVSEAAALTPVIGPAVVVTLTDAPLSVKPVGVDEDLLVVHQQDIQAVANALWGGGAEAMTIQSQRVTARTGIKCVGNSVVLHGVPYAPPYVIVAIGDQRRLEAALDASPYLKIYRQYAETYGLGYSTKRQNDVQMDGYKGAVDLRYATPMPSASQSTPSLPPSFTPSQSKPTKR